MAKKGKKKKKVKKPMGRPTAYKTRFCNLKAYLKQCEATKTKPAELPSICGYAIYLDYPQQRLHEWAKKYPDFRESLDRLKDLQEKMLLNGGLNGDFNSRIAKLILSNNHGYKERSDTTTGDEPLAPPVINVGAKK